MSFYKFDNSYMLDMMKKHPGIFSGVAVIDETASDVEGTMLALKQSGVRGFRLRAGKKEVVEAWVESPGMRTMWKYGADNGLAMCPLSNPEALPAISAMVLIGCGASLTLAGGKGAGGKGRGLMLSNVIAYAAVASLAIASQWDLASKSLRGHVDVVMIVDHAVAIVLLVLLMRWSVMVATGDLSDRG